MTRPRALRAAHRGFTLIEVITAIALTAIVTAIASAAVTSASDARSTVLAHEQTLDREARWRVMVTDMLHHAPAADAVNEPLLRIERAVQGGDRLVFLSRGVVQPFGTGRTWRVTIGGDEDGLELDAEAIGRGEPLAPLHTSLPHRGRISVSVQEDGGAWRTDWPIERARPTTLRLAFETSADGDATGNATGSATGDATGDATGIAGSSRSAAPLVVNLDPVALAGVRRAP